MSITTRATVDPGINTGIALWVDNNSIPLIESFSIQSGIGEMKQLFFLCSQFQKVMARYRPKECYIESDEFWKGDLRSETSAARGNLALLSHIIGAYYGISCQLRIDCHFIKAREWKGQMNKDIVARRVEMAIGLKYTSSHITDAVGIGLALRGVL